MHKAGPGQERIYPCQTFFQGMPADTQLSPLGTASANHLHIRVFKALRSNSPTAAVLMFMAISSSSLLASQALPGALSYAKSYEEAGEGQALGHIMFVVRRMNVSSLIRVWKSHACDLFLN